MPLTIDRIAKKFLYRGKRGRERKAPTLMEIKTAAPRRRMKEAIVDKTLSGFFPLFFVWVALEGRGAHNRPEWRLGKKKGKRGRNEICVRMENSKILQQKDFL